MSVINEIQDMQKGGKSEREIIDTLQSRGVNYKEIADSLSQAKIKAAVASDTMADNTQDSGAKTNMQEMQPSILSQEPPQQTKSAKEYTPQYPPSEQYISQVNQPEYYPEQNLPQEYSQQYQPTGLGSDTIAEISEQIVAEKMSELKQDLEKVLDLKTTVEAKIESLDDRLQRIEKIIDRLQLSVLQKVGDYITNVEDIKKEIIELEKSLSVLTPSKRSPSTTIENTQTEKKRPSSMNFKE